MIKLKTPTAISPEVDDAAIDARFATELDNLHRRTDRFFARLLLVEWLAAIGMAFAISPRTWIGPYAEPNFHVWAALLFGGAITIFPAFLGFRFAGHTATRHILAIAQMLMSALFIHLTGGRIETHFHVFGSLAFLAFYRDVRVLITATVIVYVDHLLRGYFWSASVYGPMVVTEDWEWFWRSMEHAFWVLFEVAFLTHSIRRGLVEMRQVAARQLSLEEVNRVQEGVVQESVRELAGSEARFQRLFQDSPIGLYRASPAGEMLEVNPALLQILGHSSLAEIRLHEARFGHREFFNMIATTDRVAHRDTVWPRHDGSKVHVRESARGFRDDAGTLAYISGTVEDITEQRQLEDRYLQSQKVQAIGQLAGGIAHDFNNVLTTISGYSEMLEKGTSLDPKERRHLTQIRKAADRAASLTHQLLAFSRKQTLQPRVIQLPTVVADMDQMLQRLVGEHIKIRTISLSGVSAVKADPGQIQQVVLNLVVNARDAMPRGGDLTIETTNVELDASYAKLHPEITPGRYVMLSVSDNGCGMTPAVKARVFEPFFTTKPPGSGTGLGLATCHGIVRQSGGHISVYSELGHGTVFKVYLPAVGDASRGANNSAAPFALPRGGAETVLLVEDDEAVREMGQTQLAAFGYNVLTASNGVEALSRHGDNPDIRILITDVVMPDMGGRELSRRMRQLRPQLSVLFTSGYTFDAIEHADLIESGTRFLQKPYTSAQLAAVVRELLDQPLKATVANK
jgi:PAS domain S-box-containing protein